MNLDLYAKTQFSDGKSQFSGEKTQLREILETYAAEKKQKNQSVSKTQEKKQEQVADKPPKKKEAMSL